MTKLTWTCDYLDAYVFHIGIKGGKEFEKGIKEFARRMPKILSDNEVLYEEMIEAAEFRENKCIDEIEIFEFLEEYAHENPKIMKEADFGIAMGGNDAEGILFVDGKPFPPPENWQERGEGFWCGGEHHYDEESGHTYEADGNILFRWNKDHDEKNRYKDALNKEGAIYEFQRFREGKWELEIDGDFDYMKLDFDGKKCRVLYDGKEFIKVKDGFCPTGHNFVDHCFYKGEKLPKDEYMWEGWEFPENEYPEEEE